MNPPWCLAAAAACSWLAAGCGPPQWPLAEAGPEPELFRSDEVVHEAESTEANRTDFPPPAPPLDPPVPCEIEIFAPGDGEVVTSWEIGFNVWVGALDWFLWCSYGDSDDSFGCDLREAWGASYSGDVYPAFEGPITWEFWGTNGVETCHDRVTFWVDWS